MTARVGNFVANFLGFTYGIRYNRTVVLDKDKGRISSAGCFSLIARRNPLLTPSRH